ncbi:MAG: VOC family protein [Thermoleophilia bacterium]
MPIEGIQAAIVRVSDVDAAIRFPTEALGLELGSDWPYGDGQRWVTVGPPGGAGAAIALEPAADEASVGGFAGVVLGAADPQATAAELARRGVEFPQPVTRQAWGASMGLLADPDGNVLVLHEA